MKVNNQAKNQTSNQTSLPKQNKMLQMQKPWMWSVFWWLVLFLALGVFVILAERQAPSGIVVMGERLTTPQQQQIQNTLKPLGQINFYHTHLDAIAQSLMALSWVESVEVRRDWRQGVVVTVSPKTAVANFGSEHLLGVHGDVFSPASVDELNNPRLIQLYSESASADSAMDKVQKLNLWFAPLGIVVEDMILTPRQTWLVRFNSGLRVTVDYEYVDEKLFRLSRLLIERRLATPLDDIAAIDLRYKNGFSLTKKVRAQSDG